MDKINLIARLQRELLLNNIQESKKIAAELSYDILSDTLMGLAFETKSIVIYTFVVSMLLDNETAELHSLSSDLLALPFCFIEGAYAASLYHARKCIEFEPDNVDYKEYILFFYGLPDQVITKEEALNIAKEVLKSKPTSKPALRIIEELRYE